MLRSKHTHSHADARTSEACTCLNNKAVPSSVAPQVSDPYTTAITHKHTMQTGFTSLQGVGCLSQIPQNERLTHANTHTLTYKYVTMDTYQWPAIVIEI